MGSHMTKPSNKSMVDRLVEHNAYIQSPTVESVFRAVDRAMYFDLEEGEVIDPYENDPWRRGNLHLSAPSIYAKVVEALELKSGLSFLNLGSGTGYLNTIVGLLVGPNGTNHGVELHPDVIEYAYKRLKQFKENSHAIDRFDFSEPIFIEGNCLNLNPNTRYDRIYLGAACLPDLENFMKKLIKPNGGILVMPYENHLMRYIRSGETEWRSEKLMDVNFTLMIRPGDNESMIDMPLFQAKSLKELCRIIIRQQLRDKTNLSNPSLLYSDNIGYRRLRKARAERDSMRRNERRSMKLINSDVPNGVAEYIGPLSKRLNARSGGSSNGRQAANRLTIAPREGRCCCWQYAGHNLGSSDGSRTQSQPGTSQDGSTRVLTRSASRRIVETHMNPNNKTNFHDNDSSNRKGNSSSRGTSLNEYPAGQVSSLGDTSDDEDHDDDDDDDEVDGMSQDSEGSGGDEDPSESRQSRVTADGGINESSARTRPYISANYGRQSPPSQIIWQNTRSNNHSSNGDGAASNNQDPPPLLPFPLIPAGITPPPYSSTSGSRSSSISESDFDSDSESLFAPDLEEYDYVGRQVILSWPGILGLHRAFDPSELDNHELNSSSVSPASSPDPSNPGTLELDHTESSDESSSLCECTINETYAPIPNNVSLESDNDGFEESGHSQLTQARNSGSQQQSHETSMIPRPGTSRTSEDSLPSALPTTNDQEPVANRLRSKRTQVPGLQKKITSRPDNARLMPNDAHCEWTRRYMDRPSQSPPLSFRQPLHCPIHGRYSNAVPTDPLASPPRLQETTALATQSNASPPCLLNQTNFQTYHSPAAPGQHLDEGSRNRLRALGTTLTLSSSNSVGGSFRLFERQSIGSTRGTSVVVGGSSVGGSCDKTSMIGACSTERRCKRKRHSTPSDDSSADELDDGSSHRSSPSHNRNVHHSRRRLTPSCECSNSAQSQAAATSSSTISVGGGNSSRSFGCQTSSIRPSLGALWARRQSNNHLTCSYNYCSTSQSNDFQSNCTALVNNNGSAQGGYATRQASNNQRVGSTSTGNMSSDIHHAASSIASSANDDFCLSPSSSGLESGRRGCRRTKEGHSHRDRHHPGHGGQHQRRHSSHHNCRHHPNLNRTSSHSAARLEGGNEPATSNRLGRAPVRHPCVVFDSNELANIRNRQQLRRSQLKERRKEGRKRRETECDRYHNHISGYIRRLPLPRVLHSYLNYDRHYVAGQNPALKTPTPGK